MCSGEGLGFRGLGFRGFRGLGFGAYKVKRPFCSGLFLAVGIPLNSDVLAKLHSGSQWSDFFMQNLRCVHVLVSGFLSL